MFIQMVKAALYVLAILFVFTQIVQPLISDKKFFWFFRKDDEKTPCSDLDELESQADEVATKRQQVQEQVDKTEQKISNIKEKL